MTTFFDIFASQSRPESWNDPTGASSRFPEVVAASPFHLWQPGDPIAEQGVRLLIGVAIWCGYDMRLLDVIAEALSRNPMDPPVVEVFNVDDCRRPEDLDQYIKGMGTVFIHHPPIAGLWRNGRLDWSGQGHEARELIARLFGSSSDAICAFVRNWINARASAR
jgi:hypothetical protein